MAKRDLFHPSAFSAMLARKLEVHVARRQWGVAHRILNAAEREQQAEIRERQLVPIDHQPVATLECHGATPRLLEILDKAGFSTVGQIRACTDRRLLEIPNFGPGHLRQVRKAITLAHRKPEIPSGGPGRAATPIRAGTLDGRVR